jgi:hypothetical protein
MNKRIIFSLMIVLLAFTANAQQVVEAKQVKASDSLKLKDKWIKSIITDTSLTGATTRDVASADAVVRYIINRLAFTVKYGDTTALLNGYARLQRMLDSLAAVQVRIQSKLTKANADTYYPTIQRVIDSMNAVQIRVQSKEPLLGFSPVNKSGDIMTGILTLSADPTNALHATTKGYVDNLVTGLSWKQAVKAATTANISLSGTQTIDAVSVVIGDRVLVKNQTTQSGNGIYVVASGAWTRATDADASGEILGATVYVDAPGTVNGGTQWSNNNSAAITVGTTAITFIQIAGAGVYTNGTGIDLTGNVFSINSTVVTLTGSQTLSNKTITGYLTTATAASTYAPITGSTAYIQNGTSPQTANLNITGSAVIGSVIQSTITSGNFFLNNSATTGALYAQIVNTSGSLTMGIEGSAGGAIFSGSSIYATVFGNGVNKPIELFQNNSIKVRIDGSGFSSTGNITAPSFNVTGTGTVGGVLTLSDRFLQTKSVVNSVMQISNTNSAGFGVSISAGNSSNYALLVADYTGSPNNFILYGDGHFVTIGTAFINNTTTSTTSANGALVVAGGVGIAGALNVGSTVSVAGSISGTSLLSMTGTNNSKVFNFGGATTGYLFGEIVTTGGRTIIGSDAAAGGFLASGSPISGANATVLGSSAAVPVLMVVNQVTALAFSSTGIFATKDIISTGSTTLAGYLNFTANSTQIAGSIGKNSTYGLTLYGIAGSGSDVGIVNASGTEVYRNPTGTVNSLFAGSIISGITGASALLLGTSANPGSYQFYQTGTMGVSGLATFGNSISVTGTGVFTNSVTAGSGFIKTGSSDSYVLLGGGGTTLLSSLGGTGNTYTPTLSNGAGFSSGVTLRYATYHQMGNVVEVTIYADATPSSTGSVYFNATLARNEAA